MKEASASENPDIQLGFKLPIFSSKLSTIGFTREELELEK